MQNAALIIASGQKEKQQCSVQPMTTQDSGLESFNILTSSREARING